MPCAGASHFREGCLRSPGVSTSKEPTTWEPCRNTSVQLPPAHPGPLLPARTLSWFLVSSSFFLPSPLGISCFVIFFYYYYFQIIWFLAIYILTLLSFFSEGRGFGGRGFAFLFCPFQETYGLGRNQISATLDDRSLIFFFFIVITEFIFSSIKHILSCEGNRGNGLIADSGFLSLVASLRLGSKWLSMPRHPELKYREMRTHFPSLQRSLFLSGCACFSIFIF